MPDTSRMPYLANYPTLRDWLDENEARCMWQTTTDRKPATTDSTMVEGWLIYGTLVVIMVYGRRRGWNIFTACPDINIQTTFDDAITRIRS